MLPIRIERLQALGLRRVDLIVLHVLQGELRQRVRIGGGSHAR
jgi:hypothetical protein